MRSYLEPWKKYAVFDGRACRTEYWAFFLFNIVIGFALGLVDGTIGTVDPVSGYGLLSGVFVLAALVPGLAVTFRRLHDTGRSGWWLLLAFVPLINLVFLVFMVLDGQPETNQYGPNPKAAEA